MSKWISWEEAVAVVALHFPSARAERLLHVAIQEGDAVEVWAADEGGVDLAGSPGYQYFEAQPGQLGGPDNRRHYRKVNHVDLRSLKLWLKALTSDTEPAPAPAVDGPAKVRGAEQTEQADSLAIYSSGAPGRPTSAHLVKDELQRRVTAGELCETLASEADHLSRWLTVEHPKAPPMTPKTISNSCRDVYREARKQRPK